MDSTSEESRIRLLLAVMVPMAITGLLVWIFLARQHVLPAGMSHSVTDMAITLGVIFALQLHAWRRLLAVRIVWRDGQLALATGAITASRRAIAKLMALVHTAASVWILWVYVLRVD